MEDAKRRAQEKLDRMHRTRGYLIPVHKIMVQADPDWADRYDDLVQQTYLRQGALDRKTKELLQFVVLAALRSDVDHVAEHARLAIEHGATPGEALEALECVLMPMGALGFNAGLKAWAKVVGVEELQPSADAGAPEPAAD